MAMPPGTPGIVASDTERRELPAWRLLLRRPTFVTGALILLFWVACAIFGTSIAPHSPLAQQLLATNQAPSAAHWFGTDQLGRDMLSRVIVGARTMLIIAPLATVVGTVLGTALGLALGYLGGVVDLLASRVIEAVLALPALLVIFLFMVPLGVTTFSQVLVIGFIFTPLIARTVRSAVQVERQLDYVPAARLLGERSGWMMFVEILPNVVPTILVEFTVRLGYAVFAVASLAFLGFGVQLSTPNWGTDINANYAVLGAGYWWGSLFPALAIASLIIGINLVADSVEQVVVG
jgi:peptide/nickel transport system permease protein